MAHHLRKQTRALTFNVPAAGGTFAPEVLYCAPTNDASDLDGVLDFALLSEALPVGATLHVEVLKSGTDASADANWKDDGGAWGGARAAAQYAGMLLRVRAKSGGTAGPVDAIAAWTA